MSPKVKQCAIDYFESIGGIERVKPEDRYALKRSVITLLTELEEANIFNRIKAIYPITGGVIKPNKQ